MERTVVSLRGTAFANKLILFSPSIVEYISSLFDNEKLVAIINNTAVLIPSNAISEWGLQSIDKTLNILFSFNKIDIIKNGTLNNSDIKKFISKIETVFENLMQHFSFTISRVAFAPTYKTVIDSAEKFFKDIFKKVSFNESNMLDFSFNNTFIKKEIINKEFIDINYCCNISFLKNIPNLEVMSNKELLIQIDINTSQNEKRVFTEPYLTDFYNKVESFSEELYKFYFGTI